MKNDKNWRDFLVLVSLDRVRKRNMENTIMTVITMLELVPHLTGISFDLNKILDPDAITDARKRLVTRGYLSEGGAQTDKDPRKMLDGCIPEGRSGSCRKAIEFSAHFMTMLTGKQHEAILTLVLCQSVAEWEGWIAEGQNLRDVIKVKMPDEIPRLERALSLTAKMKEIWDNDPTNELG